MRLSRIKYSLGECGGGGGGGTADELGRVAPIVLDLIRRCSPSTPDVEVDDDDDSNDELPLALTPVMELSSSRPPRPKKSNVLTTSLSGLVNSPDPDSLYCIDDDDDDETDEFQFAFVAPLLKTVDPPNGLT